MRFILLIGLLLGSRGRADEMVPAAAKLMSVIDALDVEHHWPAGLVVDWRSGVPDGRVTKTPGNHTHCSAFVAAAAERAGIYILRPPDHSPVLLANAQYDWLATAGAGRGWARLRDASAAQARANRGFFVVAIYRNHHDDKPGHVAIVRPSSKSDAALRDEGPEITQAGGTNFRATSLAHGFAAHPAAFIGGEVVYYAHAVEWPLE